VLLEKLGEAAVYASLVSIAVGGVLTLFKPWMLAQEDARNRVNLQKQRLIERIALTNQQVIDRAVLGTVPMRGDGNNPDLLAEQASETFRLLSVFRDLEDLYRSVKACHTGLFYSVVAGLIGSVSALVAPTLRQAIGAAALVVVFCQLLSVLWIRRLADRLEDYERTT
jgi:hypothetical protein